MKNTISTFALAIALSTTLGACSTLEAAFAKSRADFVLDEVETDQGFDGQFVEAVYFPEQLEVEAAPELQLASVDANQFVPITMAGQLKPIFEEPIEQVPNLKPDQAIDQANLSAAVEPEAGNFVNAIQIYPYAVGALYQVYCAPEQVTDIGLQPGEQLMSVSAGDTVRWVLGDTVSGNGDNEQVHILIKPITSGLTTNLIITTSKRTYHVEMKSFRETYMAAVSWRYPRESLVMKKTPLRKTSVQANVSVERGLQLGRLNFRYEIEGDKPHWRPVRAFDDGRKVYIQFPGRLDQGEAPPLFVVGRNGESQLVNYRINGTYYVVDRLFAAAELRLGEKDQDVVRIVRTRKAATKMAGL